MSQDVLAKLAKTIHERALAEAGKSYTRELLDAGTEKCARKLGEEAVETVIAAIAQDDGSLKGEAADLIYHLLVLLESRGVPFNDVLSVLQGRMGESGLDEKAARTTKDG